MKNQKNNKISDYNNCNNTPNCNNYNYSIKNINNINNTVNNSIALQAPGFTEIYPNKNFPQTNFSCSQQNFPFTAEKETIGINYFVNNCYGNEGFSKKNKENEDSLNFGSVYMNHPGNYNLSGSTNGIAAHTSHNFYPGGMGGNYSGYGQYPPNLAYGIGPINTGYPINGMTPMNMNVNNYSEVGSPRRKVYKHKENYIDVLLSKINF